MISCDCDNDGSNHRRLPEEAATKAAAKAATKAATKARVKGRCWTRVGVGTVNLGQEEPGPAHLGALSAPAERQLRNSNR